MKGTIPISVDTFLDRLLGDRVLVGGAQTRQQAKHYAYQSVQNCGNYLMQGGDVMLHLAEANANDDWDNVDLKRVERFDEAREIWHNDPIRQQYMALPEDQRKSMEQMNESFVDSRNRTWSQWFTYQKNWVYEQMTWQNIGVSIFLFLIVYYNVDEESTEADPWWKQALSVIKRILVRFVETVTNLYYTIQGYMILGMDQAKSYLTTSMTLGQAKAQAKLEHESNVRSGVAASSALGVGAYCLVAANPFSAVASAGIGPATCVSSVAALTVGYVSFEWMGTENAKRQTIASNNYIVDLLGQLWSNPTVQKALNASVGGTFVAGVAGIIKLLGKTGTMHLRKAEAQYQAYGTTMETAAAVLNPAAGVAARGIRTAVDIPGRAMYTQEDREFGDQVRRQLDTVAHTTRGQVQGMLKKQRKGRKARGARIKSKRAEQQRRIKNRRKVEKDYDEDVYDEDAYDPWDEDYGDVYSGEFDRPRRSPRLQQQQRSPRKKRSNRRTSVNPVRRRKRSSSRTKPRRQQPRRQQPRTKPKTKPRTKRRSSPRNPVRRNPPRNADNLDTPIPMGPMMAGGVKKLRQFKSNILRTEQKNGRNLSTRRTFNRMVLRAKQTR